MNDRVPLEQPKQEPEKAILDGISVDSGKTDDFTSMKIADLLEVSPEDRSTLKNDLKELSNWARESTNTEDDLLMLNAIKSLKSRLGLGGTGKQLVQTLNKFTRLQMTSKRLAEQQKRIGLEMNLYKR